MSSGVGKSNLCKQRIQIVLALSELLNSLFNALGLFIFHNQTNKNVSVKTMILVDNNFRAIPFLEYLKHVTITKTCKMNWTTGYNILEFIMSIIFQNIIYVN